MRYPALLTPAKEGGFVVTFRDIPEAITQGETQADAMEMAEDVLASSMDFYFDDQRQVPPPSKARSGERWVELPASLAAKVLLLNEMLAQRVTSAELARRMGARPQEVNRLTTLGHATKIDTIGRALHALGKRLEMTAV